MCGCGSAQPGAPVFVVLGSTLRVLTGGGELVAGIFFTAVAAVVEFSNAKSVGPAVGAPEPKMLWAAYWELRI